MGEKQVEIVVRDYLRKLRDNHIAVERAILFGSYATNTTDHDSDIDIAIVSADFGHNYIQEAVKLKLLALEIDPDISPRPYSAADYRNSQPGDFLFDEVMQKGRVVS